VDYLSFVARKFTQLCNSNYFISIQYSLFTRGDSATAMADLKRLVEDDEAEYMFESLEREAALNQVGIGLCLEAETLE
jgi:hypothetical protein